jgi:hypothetical protein
MPGYTKGRGEIFVQLEDQLEFAKQNAIRALAAAAANGTDNPSTRVHELVEFLQNIKARK